MGNKSKSGKGYKTQAEVTQALYELLKIWKKNGTTGVFLPSIKTQFRTEEIFMIIFENQKYFNLQREFESLPEESMTENLLIPLIYDNPEFMNKIKKGKPERITMADDKQNLPIQQFWVPEDKQTLPVLVAFELGKRRYERFSAVEAGIYGDKIPYNRKAIKYTKTIRDLADKVEEIIGTDNLRLLREIKSEEERKEYINELLFYIHEVTEGAQLTEDEVYEAKYESFEYKGKKKLLILVAGYPDSGKTTFSRILAGKIKGAIHLDSDVLENRIGMSWKLPDILKAIPRDAINISGDVVVFSDPDAFGDSKEDSYFFGLDEIKKAMGDTNIIRVFVKPKSVLRMFHNSKYRQHLPFNQYRKSVDDYYENRNCLGDIIITNDYTINSISEGCDKVIETIIRMFGPHEIEDNPRPNVSDFATRVGEHRIEEGASRIAENMDLLQETSRPKGGIEI